MKIIRKFIISWRARRECERALADAAANIHHLREATGMSIGEIERLLIDDGADPNVSAKVFQAYHCLYPSDWEKKSC